MEGQPIQKMSSCIPCAKRKVRCDRLQPCSCCKRRIGDICEFPLTIARSGKTQHEDVIKRSRVETLEPHALRACENIDRSKPIIPTFPGNQSPPSRSFASTTDPPLPIQGTKRYFNGMPCANTVIFPHSQAGLIEYNKQTTYIETYVLLSHKFCHRTTKVSILQTRVV